MENRIFGLLGLARRAGKITFGNDAVIKDAAFGKAVIIILANDAAPRTIKNIRSACEKYSVRAFTAPATKDEIGHAIGRGETAVAAITDKKFAAGIEEICRVSIQEEEY